VFDYAMEHHLDARIGLEDTLNGRDGWLARGNADLIEMAMGTDHKAPRRRRAGRGSR
jgi:uncharacterized protein (DUF849 family)